MVVGRWSDLRRFYVGFHRGSGGGGGGGFYSRLREFRENVRLFIPRLRIFFFFVKWRLARAH